MWVFLLIALFAYIALGGGQGIPIQHGPAPPLRVPQPRLEPVPLPMVEAPVVEDPVLARVRRLGIGAGQGRRADLGM